MIKKMLFILVVCFSQVSFAAEISLKDRAQILEKISSYGHYFDRRDGVGFASLYAEDGSWNAYPNKAPKALIVLKGRENIAAFANDRQQMFEEVGVETKHFMLDIVIKVESAEKVQASAMALILWQRPTMGDPLPRPVQSGYYDFSMSKGADGWKFDRVEVHTSGVYKPEEVYHDIGKP